MTKTFAYTFTRVNGEDVTLKKRVTDKMEEYDFRKKVMLLIISMKY